MQVQTHALFLEDAYLKSCKAKVLAVNNLGGIILDQTNFYATSGGQPGDIGTLELDDGVRIEIAATVKDKTTGDIVLVPADGSKLAEVGTSVICQIDWQRRYKLMQMHTACHLLSVICPFPITSANVDAVQSRVDFDMPELPGTKQEITRAMMELVEGDHAIYDEWIDEAELDDNPGLVKSKNVKPPRGVGRIRLVCIGENASIDSQPCGGTHVKSTAEVGKIHIGKIENKGKENRRFRIRFGDAPH